MLLFLVFIHFAVQKSWQWEHVVILQCKMLRSLSALAVHRTKRERMYPEIQRLLWVTVGAECKKLWRTKKQLFWSVKSNSSLFLRRSPLRFRDLCVESDLKVSQWSSCRTPYSGVKDWLSYTTAIILFFFFFFFFYFLVSQIICLTEVLKVFHFILFCTFFPLWLTHI